MGDRLSNGVEDHRPRRSQFSDRDSVIHFFLSPTGRLFSILLWQKPGGARRAVLFSSFRNHLAFSLASTAINAGQLVQPMLREQASAHCADRWDERSLHYTQVAP